MPAPTHKSSRTTLRQLEKEAGEFQDKYHGKLLQRSRKNGGAELAECVRIYEMMSDRLGRVGSYAGLLYAGDTSDPVMRQVLRRRSGEAHGDHDEAVVLSARVQPH